MAQKLALLEFGNSHDEVLYPQYRFISEHSDFEAHLFVSESLKSRLFDYPTERLHFIPSEPKRKDFRKLHRELQAQGIQKVVINTCSGKKVRNFLWTKPFTKLEYVGLLHHLRKLESSFTQKLISKKVKRYFFLAEYLAEQAAQLKPSLQFSHFYAGFLPEFPIPEKLQKPAGEIWIVVPGQLEYKRRDYLQLLESLKGIPSASPLRFILLGKSKHPFGDGLAFEEALQNSEQGFRFKTWDNFVPNAEFYAYLQQADFVLPLIHPNTAGGKLYQKQISGAWNMAMAYRIPMLIAKNSAGAAEWENAAYFYDVSEMTQLWEAINQLDQTDWYSAKKWEASHQAKAYLDFVIA